MYPRQSSLRCSCLLVQIEVVGLVREKEPGMIKELMSSRRFAPLFWAQFCSALNDNVLKNALVIMILYGVGSGHGGSLVTVAGAVFIFPFFVLSALGGGLFPVAALDGCGVEVSSSGGCTASYAFAPPSQT